MPAPTIDELLLADEGAAWAALGFAVADGCCRLGRVRLRFLADASARGIVGWSLRDLAGVELDGLATTVSAQPLPDPAPVHPNGVAAIDHIVAMSPDLDRSVGLLRAAGLDLRRIREQPTPAGAPRQAFFRLGAEILELIQMPAEAIERAGGRDRAARFWGLAVQVQDIDRTVELLGAHAGPARAAVQPGRRIATVRRSAGLTFPLALMSEPAPSARPR
jgi:catechol 2,3-dioxygenase-like lactoylglutathione lyase family enzyme